MRKCLKCNTGVTNKEICPICYLPTVSYDYYVSQKKDKNYNLPPLDEVIEYLDTDGNGLLQHEDIIMTYKAIKSLIKQKVADIP
jgi:hypothetical protein